MDNEFTQALDKAKDSGRYAIAVFWVANEKVNSHIKTERFPIADFPAINKLLASYCQERGMPLSALDRPSDSYNRPAVAGVTAPAQTAGK